MAINFFSLEKSELELKDNFMSLTSMCRKMYTKLTTMISNKVVTRDDLDKMDEYRNRITETRRDIRDDCIWIISKDQPRANHLRFIIAILYSIKDVERMADYAFTIAKILNKEKITSSMIKSMDSLLAKSIAFYDSVIQKIDADDMYECEENMYMMFDSFRNDYKAFLKESITELSSSINLANASKFVEYYFNYSIVIKYLDRVVDHALSIYKNFLLIRSKN